MCKDSMFCDLEFKQTVPAAFLNLSVTKARANDTVIVEPDVDSNGLRSVPFFVSKAGFCRAHARKKHEKRHVDRSTPMFQTTERRVIC